MNPEYEPPEIIDLGLISRPTFTNPAQQEKGVTNVVSVDPFGMELSHSDVTPGPP